MNNLLNRGDRTNVFYDAEFTGLHRNTTLISIGLVSERGAYFYAEFNDYDESQVTDWIQKNVIDKLPYKDIDATFQKSYSATKNSDLYDVKMKGSTADVKDRLLAWLESIYDSTDTEIQFFADCYAYDWVLLNDLICKDGQALNIPEFIDYIPMDLSTVLQVIDVDPDIIREDFIRNDIKQIQLQDPFTKWGSDIKHNCLWDAYVCMCCFLKCETLK